MTTRTSCTAHGLAYLDDIKLCRAVATDVANRQMRKSGRSAWNDKDYDLACDTLDRLCLNAATCFRSGDFMWPINARLTSGS